MTYVRKNGLEETQEERLREPGKQNVDIEGRKCNGVDRKREDKKTRILYLEERKQWTQREKEKR